MTNDEIMSRLECMQVRLDDLVDTQRSLRSAFFALFLGGLAAFGSAALAVGSYRERVDRLVITTDELTHNVDRIQRATARLPQ